MKKENKLKDETINDIMQHYSSPDKFGEFFNELKKAIIEKALERELDYHLGYAKSQQNPTENSRNGHTAKTIIMDSGRVTLKTPRDRQSDFEPQIVQKYQRRLTGFDDKIISMYARGMSMQDIQEHLLEIYGTEVSKDLISSVTDGVVDEVKAWQNRPLETIYPILYLDCLCVKVKENNQILNKAVYLAIGVNLEGNKEVLGMWIGQNEGAKFWLSVITEIKNRGVEKIYIACVDGLKGFPEAINSVFPKTIVQLCIVHMIRNSLNYVPYKDRKAVAVDLKGIYTAVNAAMAEEALKVFREKWDKKYPSIGQSWQRNWVGIIPFLSFPEAIRKAIYTTNVIESVNRQIRKVIKSKGVFPNDESVFKLLYLVLRNAQKKWTMPIRDWKEALNHFIIFFQDSDPLDI